jgi:protein dithiol oxidoreductase (disulfide-forming)
MTIHRLTLAVIVLVIGVDACVRDKSTPSNYSQPPSPTHADSIKGSYNLVWTEGINYRLIGQPVEATDSDHGVDVIEFFQYGCGHCYVLEPWVTSWDKGKQSFVHFERIPVTYNRDYLSHARLFYALKELGRVDARGPEDLHHEVFDTIQRMGDPLVVFGDAEKSEKLQIKFALRFGISADVFHATYASPQVAHDLHEAELAVDKYKIEATPTFVVAGMFVTDAGLAGGSDRLIILLDDLANHVHSATNGR